MGEIDVRIEIERTLDVEVTNPAFPPGHARRYGAKEDGIVTAESILDAEKVRNAIEKRS